MGDNTNLDCLKVNKLFVEDQAIKSGMVADFEANFPALSEWVVNHNLGKQPVSILTTPGGAEIDAEIIHTSSNQFIAYFAGPTAGHVRCV